jgi:hypothetical protein
MFERDVLNVPLGWTKEDLKVFFDIAHAEHPALAQIIHGYIELAYRSDSHVRARPSSRGKPGRSRAKQMHLFDLLREKAFFPQNLELSRFASRVLPHMRAYRFDKMSRSDIAARIIEYIEGSDPGTREALEVSMREALDAMRRRPPKDSERQSFLSKWEDIIKGNAD